MSSVENINAAVCMRGAQRFDAHGSCTCEGEVVSGRFRKLPSTTNNVRPPAPFLSCSTRTKICPIGTPWLCGGCRQDKIVARSSPPGLRRLPRLHLFSCQGSLNQIPGNLHFRRRDPGQYRSCYWRHGYPRQPRPFNRTATARSC